MAWSQSGGKDVFAAVDDILATPPIFTIPAGGSQVIRVGSRRAPDPQHERAYRLFLREVPPAPQPGFQGSAEHTSELPSLMRLAYAAFFLNRINLEKTKTLAHIINHITT